MATTISDEELVGQALLNAFESAVCGDGGLEQARSALRRYLFAKAGSNSAGSLGDAIMALAQAPVGQQDAAAVVLRALAVPGLVQDNSVNRISLHVVQLAESAVSELCEFIGVKQKAQTFEKYDLLRTAHARFLSFLEPLRTPYTTIESVLGSKRVILGGVNHGQVRSYCRTYRLPEVKDVIESLLAKVARVQKMESTLIDDVEACHRNIADARELVRLYPSFLTIEFLDPLLRNTATALDGFLGSVRSRFVSDIMQVAGGTTELQKRYPLHEEGRELRVAVPLRITGPGPATDVIVRISCDSEEVALANAAVSLGTQAPGNFPVDIDVLVTRPCGSFDAMLHVEWGELGTSRRKEDLFQVRVLAQRTDIDWASMRYAHPYSTAPAEGVGFIGRDEQLQTLVSRMLRSPMEPSYVTGQKRVGKTSLARAAVEEARKEDPRCGLTSHYMLWGDLAHEDSRMSLRQLGEQIEEFILSNIPGGETYPRGRYEGTLSPLIRLAAHAKAIDPDRRFVVIIDEFDEMPQDLFMQGNLAETFFANVRAITATSNICLLLVGGENMPFVMERQGQKLNKFSRVNLNYFSRLTEWDDYEKLVREPTRDTVIWHADAVTEIYNLTNGNPYFSKIICSEVFSRAVLERDADVTVEEVRRVVNERISTLDTNLFIHLWQDGISGPIEEREPVVLKRRRVLAAIARCVRQGEPATLASIEANQGTASLSRAELGSLLNNFVARGVLAEDGPAYRLVLPIFGKWLEDVGLNRLASDALSEELASMAQRGEDEAHVRSEEIVRLVDSWPTYRGRHVGTDDVRNWLGQRSSNRDQRLLFTLLKAVRFVREEEILAKFRSAQTSIRDSLPPFVKRKLSERRRDIVITYVDGEGKSGQKYASSYAEENGISVNAILSPSNFGDAYRNYSGEHGQPGAVLIIDDIVGSGRSLSENVVAFFNSHRALFEDSRPIISVYALLAAASGHARLLKAVAALDYPRIDFRAGEILADDLYVFAGERGVFATADDRDRAKALATDVGSTIYRRSPLGVGDLGILVVFPTTVPNNTLPILHSHSKGGAPQWRPLFQRLTN